MPDNPYAGIHTIKWDNLDFPADGNYDIEVEVDDNVNLFIGDVSVSKKGFKPNSDTGTGKSTFTKFFKKGKYQLRAELEQIPGGRFAFIGPDSSPQEQQQANVSARFIKKGNEIYLKVDGSGSAEIFSLKTRDKQEISGLFARTVKIGDAELERTNNTRFNASGKSRFQGRPTYTDRIEEKETIKSGGVYDAGKEYLVQTIGSSATTGSRLKSNGNIVEFDDDAGNSFDVNGTLSIGSVRPVAYAKPRGVNPMSLAVRITGSRTEVTRISPKSWNQNPMGVALTIDAPEPIVPQEPPPVQDGRCPPNPIWTTRTSGAKEQWFPVTHSYPGNVRTWSDFTNRYAMSPIKPLVPRGYRWWWNCIQKFLEC